MTVRLAETTPLSEAGAGTSASGRMKVHAITAGLGSSGYYSPDVLREAASKKLIAKGTPLFLDHASETERHDRPERSVRDIAAVFTEAATYDDAAEALVGEIQVFAPYRDLLVEMAPHIGLSISGSATDVTEGEVDGRRVPVVEALARIDSVDFVTRAGRGGRVVELLESARGEAFTEETARLQLAEARNVGQWIESRLHLELTRLADDMFGEGRLTREERIALSSAVGDGLTAFTAALEDRAPVLYTRDLWQEPEQMLAAEESRRDDPVTRPGSTTANPTQESKEDTMPQIEEARLRELEEAAGRVSALESERDTERQAREAAERALAEARAREAATTRARARVREANANLPTATVDRIVAEATRTVPLTDAGQLDETALDTAVDQARTAEESYLAGLAESTGSGLVRGFGSTTNGGEDTTVSEADIDTAVAGAFGRTVKEA